MRVLIKNGTILDPSCGRKEMADLMIENGRFLAIGKSCDWEAEEIIDATGLVVAPGLVDVHVHFRDPGFTYKEDLVTGTNAAAAGGFTTVVCMANTKPIVDDPAVMEDILTRAAGLPVHVKQVSAVSKGFQGKEHVDHAAMVAAGACGFSDDGIPLTDSTFIKAAMEAAARYDLPISLHEEDPTLNEVNGVNKGKVSDALGIGGAPAASEDVMVARDVMLALETGAKVDIQHISSGRSVELVRQAKAAGARVYAEATPHHFSLTEEAVLAHGTLAKMNPPLRTAWDREKIIEGIKDGTIDMIATDHAPHAEEEKAREFTKAPSGIIGLETALALGITNLVEPGYIDLMTLMEKMSYNPAKLYGFDAGTLAVGAQADLVIFDPRKAWTVAGFASKAKNSPFLGETLKGMVAYTICDGKIVYKA